MDTLDLIQQQRQIAHRITAGLTQYHQAIANAAAQEREQAKIESARQQSRQDAEREYRRAIEAIFDKEPESAKLETRRSVLAKAEAATVTPATDLDSIQAVKSAMVALQSTTYTLPLVVLYIIGAACWLISVVSIFVFFVLAILGFVMFAILWICVSSIEFSFYVSKCVRLKSLYMRWLELIDKQAQAEKASAQRTCQQEREKAGQALVAMVEEVKPALSQFTALANSACPPWENKVWQQTTVGVGAAGIVRLGTFLLDSEQGL